MALRVYALYGRTRKVLLLLLVVCLSDFTVMDEFLFLEARGVQSRSTYLLRDKPPNTLGCPVNLHGSNQNLSIIVWVVRVLVAGENSRITVWPLHAQFPRDAAILSAFATYKCYQILMEQRSFHVKEIFKRRSFTPLLLIILRDESMLFIIGTTSVFVSAAIYSEVRGPLEVVFLPWVVGTNCFVATRLILNLREAGDTERDESNDSARFGRTSTTLAFNSVGEDKSP
ncbi:hypothetical protein M422DRAFT_243289 [Sphaerobolus stellatus SS14]|nr:hypothetical protein M422DRAFT_243289 [Sphaerobolus stellatus SS14]